MQLRHDFDDRDLTWHLQVHRDYDDAFLCLESLRRIYPTSRVVMVSDGDDDARWPFLAADFNIEYSKGAPLYGLEHGGQMLKRMLVDGLAKPCSYIFKIDTDTHVHRRFRFLPSGCVVFGTHEHQTEILHVPLNPPNVQGGFNGYTRQAAQKILDSGLLDKAEMLDWKRTYADVPDALFTVEQRGKISSDFQLRYVCKRLQILTFDFSEVRSHFMKIPKIGDFAVSHPHKTQPRVFPKSQMFAVKTLRFKLKIKRWLHQ